MGKIITKQIKDKLLPLIQSDDETNWYIALQILKSLDGVDLNGIEKSLAKQLKDYHNDSPFKIRRKINTFFDDNFKNKVDKLKQGSGLREMIDMGYQPDYQQLTVVQFDEFMKSLINRK